MNKLLTKVAKLALGLSLAAGVGVAIGSKGVERADATEVAAYTLDGTIAGTGNSYAGNGSATQSNVAWIVNGNLTTNPWRIGTPKSGSAGTRIAQSQAVVSTENITKVVVSTTKPASNAISPTNVSLKVGTSVGGSQTSSLSNGSWAATVTFNRPNGADWSSKYFEIDFAMPSNSDTKNAKFIQFNSAVFYYEATGPVTYTITYDGNTNTGGSVPVDNTAYSSGASATVLGNINNLEKTDFSFVGWNTHADGSGTSYDAGDPIEVTGNITLYAQWEYAVRYIDDTTNSTITWDLTHASQASTSASAVSWESPKASMDLDKNSSSNNADAYCPPSKSSFRFYTGHSLTITPESGYKITSIVFSATEDGYATAFGNSTFTNATASVNASTVTLTPTNRSVAVSAVITGTCGFSSVVVHYEVVTSTASVYLNKTEVTLRTTQSEGVTVTATVENVDSPTYTWSTLDSNIELTGVNTATVTIKPDTDVAGEATVNLTVGGTSPALSASVNVTLVAPAKGEAPETAYTVAEAIAAIDVDKTATINDVYVTGLISQIDSYNSSYHSITYWISDDGTTTTQFEVYGGKNLNNTNFTSEDDIVLQAEVIVFGNIKYYSNDDIYEFASNNYLVSYIAPAAPTVLSYHINASNSLTSDSGTALTSSSWTSNVAGDTSGVTFSSANKAYPGKESSIKFNSSSATGSLVLTTADESTIGRVILRAKYYGTDTGAKVKVNNGTAQSLTSSYQYYIFDLGTASATITIAGATASNGRFYVSEFTFVKNSHLDAINAFGFAANFMNSLDEECSNKSVSSSTWSSLNTAWTTMGNTNGEQTYFLSKTAATRDAEGNTPTGDIIEKALARYDVIIASYTSYTDFMSRGNNSGNKIGLLTGISNSNTIAAIVIISLVSVTAIGGYFFIKRREEN